MWGPYVDRATELIGQVIGYASSKARELGQEHSTNVLRQATGANKPRAALTQDELAAMQSGASPQEAAKLRKPFGQVPEGLSEGGGYGIGIGVQAGVEIVQGKAIEKGLGAAEDAAEVAISRRAQGSGARPGLVRRGSPEPNLGKARQHGGPVHNENIDRVAKRMEELGWRDIRKNQRQVDTNLDTVGTNRTDISGINPKTGQRVNIEFDTDPRAGLEHQKTVVPNDPNAVNTFVVIDPKTGKPIAAKTYK